MSITRVVLVMLWVVGAADACPFCGPPPDSPGVGMMTADATVAAEVVGRRLAFDADGSGRVVVLFKVIKVVRGAGPAGATFSAAFTEAVPAPADGRTVVTLKKRGGGFDAMASYPDADGSLTAYLTGLAALPTGPAHVADRVAFYFGGLEHANPEVAADAHGQFASVPFADLVAHQDRLSARRLREWLASDRVPSARKGLYGLMLSAAGEASDAALLDEALAKSADSAAAVGGLLAARCRLAGRAAETLAPIVADPARGIIAREGAVRAAGFLWENSAAGDRPPLLAVLKAGLADAVLFPYVIEELVRMGEFSLTEEIRAAWNDPRRGGKAQTVRLFIRKYGRALPEPRRLQFGEWLDKQPQ